MPAQQFTNHLVRETSLYLKQHAHNPVDWHPWGPEALDRARSLDRPIFLSIGYSACHWCHVMEHESFVDPEIAAILNEHFVSIKVDREERPDLDQIYMAAVQLMTGQGGWPMSMFLTPDLKPFFGGTYFPPENKYGRTGFKTILKALIEAWQNRRGEVNDVAEQRTGQLQAFGQLSPSDGELTPELLRNAATSLARGFDSRYGGFGQAPKFPHPMELRLLLRTWQRFGSDDDLNMVRQTLDHMAMGGIYDHLGGGFHRYSTDARWLVPHFEKMLYDNALLSRLYLHVYQLTGEELFRRVVVETLDYVAREMRDSTGAFYSTQDADSEGVEGKFFVWDKSDIDSLLGADDARLFCAYYGVTVGGNFEEKNILNVERSAEEVARESGVSVERLIEAVERGRRVLFEEREKRIKPGRDEKVITGWNGLMLESFAEAAAVLGREEYREIAERNAGFIVENLMKGGRLLHVYKDGRAKHAGFLDDYSYVISALVTLFETTGTLRWFEEALRLTETMINEFWDDEDGGFFYN